MRERGVLPSAGSVSAHAGPNSDDITDQKSGEVNGLRGFELHSGSFQKNGQDMKYYFKRHMFQRRQLPLIDVSIFYDS